MNNRTLEIKIGDHDCKESRSSYNLSQSILQEIASFSYKLKCRLRIMV